MTIAVVTLLAELASPSAAQAGKPRVLEGEPVVGKAPPWIRRHPPDSTVEFEAFAGVLTLPDAHPLLDRGFDPGVPAGPNFGLRMGYYRWRWFGFEGELALAPTSLRDAAGWAPLISSRGHLVGRLAVGNIIPFALVGGGALTPASRLPPGGARPLPVVDFGGGLAVFLDQWGYSSLFLRLEARDAVTGFGGDGSLRAVHSFEASLSIGVGINIMP